MPFCIFLYELYPQKCLEIKKSIILKFGKSTNCSVHWESCRNASSDSNRSVTNSKNPSAKYSEKYFQTDWKSIPMFLSEFQSLQLLLLGRLFSGFDTKDYSKIDYCKLKLIIWPKRNTQTGFFNLSFLGSIVMAMFWQFDIPWWWSNSRSAVTRECLKWILLNLWICFHCILIPT